MPTHATAELSAAEVSAAAADNPSELALAIELGHVAVWRLDIAQQRVYPNLHAWEVLGLPAADAGMSMTELRGLLHPDDLEAVVANTEVTLASVRPTVLEARYRRPDGSWRHVLMHRAVQRDSQGTPLVLIAVGIDITERIQQREQAEEMVRRFELVTRTAGIGYWMLEEGAERAIWSDELRTIFGLPKGDPVPVLDAWLASYVHPADREDLRRSFASRAAGDVEPTAREFRALRPDGSVRHLLAHSRIEIGNHRPMLFGVVIDLTERRDAERALRRADERVALATRGAGLGIWELDLQTGETHWDDQMWLLRGRTPQPQAMTHEERMACVHPDDRLRVEAACKVRREIGTPREDEFRIVRPDGQVRWLATRSVELTDEMSGTRRQIGVNWDVTDTRNADGARREREVAQRESQAKSKFLARMSHELRTPLNAVLGFSQLLLSEDQGRDAAAAARRRRLEHIRSAGQHLLTLINDVLDLSSLQGGEMPIRMQPVALAPLVDQALTMLGPLIEAGAPMSHHHGGQRSQADSDAARVSVHTGPLQYSVMADATRLRQVLLNLLSNAVKYNREGGRVDIEAMPRGEHVLLRVADTGRGMSEEQLQHLFEPFNRLGVQRDGIDAIEGTGIGLAIVKALVEHMGGSVHVDSTAGVGSVFELRLLAARPHAASGRTGDREPPEAGPVRSEVWPAVAAATGAAGPGGSATAAPLEPRCQPNAAVGKRVLYIEDNPINALIIAELIARRPDLALQVAVDGASGVAQAASLLPDLVLLDMQLPDFDGFEVLRRLRADPATAAIPVIALSANAMPDDIDRALRAGMSDYWTKPLDFAAFMASLDRLFGPQAH